MQGRHSVHRIRGIKGLELTYRVPLVDVSDHTDLGGGRCCAGTNTVAFAAVVVIVIITFVHADALVRPHASDTCKASEC